MLIWRTAPGLTCRPRPCCLAMSSPRSATAGWKPEAAALAISTAAAAPSKAQAPKPIDLGSEASTPEVAEDYLQQLFNLCRQKSGMFGWTPSYQDIQSAAVTAPATISRGSKNNSRRGKGSSSAKKSGASSKRGQKPAFPLRDSVPSAGSAVTARIAPTCDPSGPPQAQSVPSSSVAASSQSLDPQPALERTKNDPSSTADAATYTLERSSCFTSHPHVTSCVLAEVSRNAQGREVTVALKTTVHLTESDAYVQLSDLEELGWLATRDAATDIASGISRRTALPPAREERHAHVCHMLRYGTVVDAVKLENSFGHISYVVTLEDKKTKEQMKALFKPRVEGDCEGWHRTPIEVAAYQLNLLLGLDVVPPAIFRGSADAGWQHFEHGGVFIYMCANAQELSYIPQDQWFIKPAALLSDTRILDVLIHNSDRHAGHFLAAEHWADGVYEPQGVWKGRLYPVLIDHAAGFRHGAWVSLEHENAFCTGPTRRISAKTYMRLRFLTQTNLQAVLRDLVTAEEITSLLKRRDEMLQYFDKLVESEGYGSVVLEDVMKSAAKQ